MIWLRRRGEIKPGYPSSVYRFLDLPGASDALDYDLLVQDRDYLRPAWKWILAELFTHRMQCVRVDGLVSQFVSWKGSPQGSIPDPGLFTQSSNNTSHVAK